MEEERIKTLLADLKEGRIELEDCLEKLKDLPFEDIGVACIDHHRGLRRGASEVIFGEGKEVSDIIAIMEKMNNQDENIMVTRLSSEKAKKLKRNFLQVNTMRGRGC